MRSRVLAIVGLGVVLVLSLAHPSSTRMLTWPWAVVATVIWALPVVEVLRRLGGKGEFRVPERFALSGLLLLAFGAVLSAWFSPFSAASLAHAWPTLAGVAFCLLLHDSFARTSANTALGARVAALAGGVLIAGSLVEWINAASPALFETRNAFPFGHSNYTAGFIVLAFPWLIYRAWITRGAARIGWLVTGALAIFALVGTSSRGGALALVAAAGVAGLVILVRASWPRGRKIALAGALVAVGIAVIVANPRLRDLVLRRTWSEAAQESNSQRTAMLEAGRLLGAERPLLGWGPGTVPLAYPHVRAQLDGGVENVLQLHDTPVQLWATLGSLGLAAVALMLAGVIVAGRAAFANPLGATAAASLGGYALFSLTDHQLDLPALTAFVAFDFAVFTAAVKGAELAASFRRLTLAIAGVLLCLAPGFAFVRNANAREFSDQALDALEAGRTGAALRCLDSATRRAPHDPYFQHRAADILLGLRDTTTDPARRDQFTRDAIAQLEASLATGAFEEYAHFNLGWLLLDTGDFAASARHFTAAARLVPDKGGVYFGLGLALQAAGRSADATRAFALEGINDPRSLTSPAWEVPALAALRPAIRAETARLFGEIAKDYPSAAAVAAWTRWWSGEAIPSAEFDCRFVPGATDFVAALPALAARQPVSSESKWAQLYHAWLARSFPVPAVATDNAEARALTRRAQRHGDDFLAFLRAGSEDEAALMRTYRRTRTGYGVLAGHPDGPALADAYIVQENVVIADFAAELFPPKGWLPGRFLLALLPPDPR